ncbi:Bug family tripartite tricarboxylate transporter substrate binding protein [Roseomonas chloroacetimidivorans]|uniref:Bug family tripartite tricarboxylate transporter substrate binding protein n=1 Tax=Roseomonas chloroacetimidivorans TaxID=1766656 RepID=UPI003C770406
MMDEETDRAETRASRRGILAAGLATAGLPTRGWAQERYPSRPVRIIIPFAPGGITDTVARLLAEQLSVQLGGVTVVAENKPGATGFIGMREVINAPPDGHTLLVTGLSSMALAPAVNPNARLDPLKDFTPLSLSADYPIVMVVNSKLGVNSLEEFISYAKGRPQGVAYGSVGVGSIHQLVAELFAQQTGLRMIHVPSRGGPTSLLSLISGDLDVMFEVLPVTMPFIADGQLRALAVLSKERITKLPELPTMIERGLSDVVLTSWIGVYGPARMPTPLRDRLSNLFITIVKDPATQARLRQIGFDPIGEGGDAFAQFHAEQVQRWTAFVRERGIGVE